MASSAHYHRQPAPMPLPCSLCQVHGRCACFANDYFNDRRVGNLGNDGVDREDYAQQLAANPVDTVALDTNYRRYAPINAGTETADFDENYQPINAGFPESAPAAYTVRVGDTLESIARVLWGDGLLWYLIAESNAMPMASPGTALIENTVIRIPNVVTNIHNNADTFKPYNAGRALGDTSPTLPAPPSPPPPPRKKGRFGVNNNRNLTHLTPKMTIEF